MTVAELIEKLKEMPQDMEVYDWQDYPVEEPVIKTIDVWSNGQIVDGKSVVMLQ